MRRNKTLLLYCFVLLSFVWACSTSSTSTRYDYTYLYDKEQKIIKPKLSVFHSERDSSTLFFELNSTDILYSKLKNKDSSIARIWVKYRLFSDDASKTLVDSTTQPLINYGANGVNNNLQAYVKFKTEVGKQYLLELRFRDANKDLNIARQLKVDKRKNNNQQYFLFKAGDQVIFNQQVSSANGISILKSPLVSSNNFSLNTSTKSFSMTPPPFVEAYFNSNEISSDFLKEVTFENNKAFIDNYQTINWLGATTDSSQSSAYFYHFYEGFPEITKLEQMVEPIRYISTSSEYKSIKAAINPKKAIDAFWLKLGREEQRTKDMIKEYYSRVENANLHFTSYKEGWKTDRGIIHIIYGKPTNIYKTVDSETWIYGEENNILSTKFTFYKKNNFMSGNDFELIRNPEYKNAWYRAVDLWRQAKVY